MAHAMKKAKNMAKRIAKGTGNGIKNSTLRTFHHLKPKRVWIMDTDLCNSACIMCNIWQNKKTFEPLSPAEIKKALSDPIFDDLEYIIQTGGEPTVREDLKEFMLAQHEARPNATLHLGTNGIL